MLKICFIMYPWENISPEGDSTLRLIHECVKRGHEVAITTIHDLIIKDSLSQAFCNIIINTEALPITAESFYKRVKFQREIVILKEFDGIFMRANPPLDALALNFLDAVRDEVFIMNDINGLRIANNKLYTASFQDELATYLPETHVSKNRNYLTTVFNETPHQKMVLKPLNGFGGKGVIVIDKSAKDSFNSLIDFYVGGSRGAKGNYVILQEYVEGAREGDLRILILNGKVIAVARRVPAANEVRSNIHAGGHYVKHTLTPQEEKLCELIGPLLVKHGLYFVGIDVINNKLIEVNVQSPGGIARMNKLYGNKKFQTKVIDFLEEAIAKHQQTLAAKHTL